MCVCFRVSLIFCNVKHISASFGTRMVGAVIHDIGVCGALGMVTECPMGAASQAEVTLTLASGRGPGWGICVLPAASQHSHHSGCPMGPLMCGCFITAFHCVLFQGRDPSWGCPGTSPCLDQHTELRVREYSVECCQRPIWGCFLLFSGRRPESYISLIWNHSSDTHYRMVEPPGLNSRLI